MPTMGGTQFEETEQSKSTIKGYWENYQKWTADAQRGFEQQSASVKARLSAGGIKAGSEQWNVNLARLESEYEEDIKGIEKGVTATELRKWSAKRQEAEYLKEYDPAKYYFMTGSDSVEFDRRTEQALKEREKGSELGMSEYLTSAFGELEATPLTEEEQATQTAKREGSGSTGQSTTTGSPWW